MPLETINKFCLIFWWRKKSVDITMSLFTMKYDVNSWYFSYKQYNVTSTCQYCKTDRKYLQCSIKLSKIILIEKYCSFSRTGKEDFDLNFPPDVLSNWIYTLYNSQQYNLSGIYRYDNSRNIVLGVKKMNTLNS